MNNSVRGGNFERSFCGYLSEWWSGGRRDDLFWRTAGSGGRAKRRGRGGKKTHGQHGDICATHPRAEPFVRAFTLELKRGYGKYSPFDVMEKGAKSADQMFEKWVAQAEESADHAGSLSWMVVFQKAYRSPVVALPTSYIKILEACGANQLPYLAPNTELYFKRGEVYFRVSLFQLEGFFETVKPRHVKMLLE